MSLEKYNLNDRYSNLEFIKSCLSKNNSSNNIPDYKKKFDPKFKLPPLVKATSESTLQHEIWHSNIKYNKIKGNIKLLRKFLSNTKSEPLELDDIETESKTDDTTLTTRSKDSSTTFISIDTYVDDIVTLDEKLEKKLLEYQEIKSNRIKQQVDICKEIQSLDSCPFEKRNSEKFLKICKYKKDPKKKVNSKPKFVAKRIKNSKPKRPKSKKEKTDMNNVVLTDQEKIRIQQLLADIDDDETDQIPTKDTNTINHENAFILDEEHKNKLNNIQDELQKFIDESVIREAKNKVDAIKYEQINWKDIKNLTMKEIDKALEDIQKEKQDAL